MELLDMDLVFSLLGFDGVDLDEAELRGPARRVRELCGPGNSPGCAIETPLEDAVEAEAEYDRSGNLLRKWARSGSSIYESAFRNSYDEGGRLVEQMRREGEGVWAPYLRREARSEGTGIVIEAIDREMDREGAELVCRVERGPEDRQVEAAIHWRAGMRLDSTRLTVYRDDGTLLRSEVTNYDDDRSIHEIRKTDYDEKGNWILTTMRGAAPDDDRGDRLAEYDARGRQVRFLEREAGEARLWTLERREFLEGPEPLPVREFAFLAPGAYSSLDSDGEWRRQVVIQPESSLRWRASSRRIPGGWERKKESFGPSGAICSRSRETLDRYGNPVVSEYLDENDEAIGRRTATIEYWD